MTGRQQTPPAIFSVAIQDQVLYRRFERESLSQLLNDPGRRRVGRDIDVEDPPSIVADNEKTVQHAERNCWDGKEVHPCNRFLMISQEGQPRLGWYCVSRHPAHPRNCPLGNIESEH
jgi:hypothetical protein